MTIETVLTAAKTLPAEFDIDALFEKLIIIEKIEEGLKALEEGRTKTIGEVQEIVKTW